MNASLLAQLIDILIVDVLGSHDPDVAQGNMTGMWVEALCYTNSCKAHVLKREALEIVSAPEYTYVCGVPESVG